MTTFEGKNLCERQKELNFKVIEAAQNQVNFEEVKSAEEHSDVDRLFKIDLASKYRDTDYFIEVLKCGDSLYISRTLKWDWIYENAYSHIVNPDYLHNHIFPTMSFKMKVKTLSTIAKYVRDETRAQIFYDYCINHNMRNNAYKFLIFTTVFFKQEVLPDFLDNNRKLQDHKDMIGNSFLLADLCGQRIYKYIKISDLSYMYSVNEVEYLKLLEKYFEYNDYYFYNDSCFGSKMSRSILKKHKSRVLNNPLPYLSILKKSELIKYSSPDDAKIFAVALLPKDVNQFWRTNYYKQHKLILELVKPESMFTFMKQIFSDKYPNIDFDMDKNFFCLKYYEFMTANERETWALLHLEKQTDVICEDQYYLWYEFVSFPQAFEAMKKKIFLTTNPDKRSEMLNVLPKSAKTQGELKELLIYYYTRHVNERPHLKEKFLKSVRENHKVFKLDAVCWDAFDNLLQCLGVYDAVKWSYEEFVNDSLVYHIINQLTLPNKLNQVTQHLNAREIKIRSEELNAEEKDLVFNYVLQFLTDKIKGFENIDYTDEVRKQVRGYLDLMITFKKDFQKDEELPEIALKFMNLDFNRFKNYLNINFGKTQEVTEGFFIRCLKKDPSVLLNNFSLIEETFNSNNCFRINMLLKKIKIYFSNDLAKQYLDLCTTSILKMTSKHESNCSIIFNRKALFANIFQIFQLGNEQIKTEFMDKHAPVSSKIEHDKIDDCILYTQEAVCRFHYYSRPPVPHEKTALYLKGDYVHMCNDMLNSYLMNLTPRLRTEFIKFLLDSPVSIQKRGLRLAFYAFEAREIKNIVSNVWKKTKNVSVRSNLYKWIIVKMNKEKKNSQLELFELLNELTIKYLTIHQDDDEELFQNFSGRDIPTSLKGIYLITVWKTVSSLPEKQSNIQRKTEVARAMASNILVIDEPFVEALVHEHIHKKLLQEQLSPEENPRIKALNDALWELVGEYIVHIPTEIKQEKSLKVVKLIVEECFNHWNETLNTEEFIYQLFFKEFARKIDVLSSYIKGNGLKVSYIFEYFLESFEKKFGIREMYSYLWDWKLSVITWAAIGDRDKFDKTVVIRFGSELGNFVKQLLDRKSYYNSFSSKILGKVKRSIQSLNNSKIDSMSESDVKVLVAYALILHETVETSVLALHILPDDLSNKTLSLSGNELQEVINIIKNQNNDELIAYMNEKFVYNDCKVRKFMA